MIYSLQTRNSQSHSSLLFSLLFSRRSIHPHGGLFGFYGMAEWWNIEFSEKEKLSFKEAFEKNLVQISFESLYIGKKVPLFDENGKKKTAIGFLVTLLDILLPYREYDDISQKFFNKCTEFVNDETDVFDLLRFFSLQILFYGRLKITDKVYELPYLNATRNKAAILQPYMLLPEAVF